MSNLRERVEEYVQSLKSSGIDAEHHVVAFKREWSGSQIFVPNGSLAPAWKMVEAFFTEEERKHITYPASSIPGKSIISIKAIVNSAKCKMMAKIANSECPIDYLVHHPDLIEYNITLDKRCFDHLLTKTPWETVKRFPDSSIVQIHYPADSKDPACDMVLDKVDENCYMLKSFDSQNFNYVMHDDDEVPRIDLIKDNFF